MQPQHTFRTPGKGLQGKLTLPTSASVAALQMRSRCCRCQPLLFVPPAPSAGVWKSQLKCSTLSFPLPVLIIRSEIPAGLKISVHYFNAQMLQTEGGTDRRASLYM